MSSGSQENGIAVTTGTPSTGATVVEVESSETIVVGTTGAVVITGESDALELASVTAAELASAFAPELTESVLELAAASPVVVAVSRTLVVEVNTLVSVCRTIRRTLTPTVEV